MSIRLVLLLLSTFVYSALSDVTVVTQPIVTTLPVTATSLSTIIARYTLSTSTLKVCDNNNGFGMDNCQTQLQVVSVPVTSEVTEFVPTVTTSTVGFTTISSTVTASTATDDAITATPASLITTSSLTPSVPAAAATLTASTPAVAPPSIAVSTSQAANAVVSATAASTTTSSAPAQSSSASTSSSPNPTLPVSTTDHSDDSSSDLSSGAKAGIAIAVILFFAAIVVGAFWLGRRTGFAKFRRVLPVGSFGMTRGVIDGGAAGAAGATALGAAAVTRDDDSVTQVDANSHLGMAKGIASQPDSPTTSTAPANSSATRHDMEDLESARMFFSRAKV